MNMYSIERHIVIGPKFLSGCRLFCAPINESKKIKKINPRFEGSKRVKKKKKKKRRAHRSSVSLLGSGT